MQSVQEALAALKNLATASEMKAAAEKQIAPDQRPKVNSHIHIPPNFSAFQSVAQAVNLAAEQNVKVLGVSNYYHYGVYGEFAAAVRAKGIFPLFGLEIICLLNDLVKAGVKINDPGNPGKMYLCGKGITQFDPMNAQASQLIRIIRTNDSHRMAAMVKQIAAVFESRGVATGVTEETVKDMIVRRHGSLPQTVYLQERHVAQAFQEALFARVPAEGRIAALNTVLGAVSKSGPDDAVKIQNDIRSHLMKAGKVGYVEETFVNFPEAYQLILELGGIPCYPTLADGVSPVTHFEQPVEKLIESLKQRRIYMAEFIPLRNAPAMLSQYVKAMRAAGIVVVGGTEHNTLDLLPIEPACVGNAPVPEDVRELFWEGACVVAAHQFLTLNGQCGFVDAGGKPNPAYTNDNQRIKDFARLGAAVIAKYFASNN